MKVKLINYTPEPEKTVAAAAYTCHSKECAVINEMSKEKIRKIIRATRSSGHHSVMEHASFTFAVDGISRSCTHQLVRHRIASFSQQSQRYVNLSRAGCVIPKTVEKNAKTKKIFEKIVKDVWDTYNKLVENGIPDEDARYVLPNAAKTSIVVTMNARELYHFFSLRCCNRAQWEIRNMANKMLKQVKRVAPVLFEEAGPMCKQLGYCPETESCGLMPMKKDVLMVK